MLLVLYPCILLLEPPTFLNVCDMTSVFVLEEEYEILYLVCTFHVKNEHEL